MEKLYTIIASSPAAHGVCLFFLPRLHPKSLKLLSEPAPCCRLDEFLAMRTIALHKYTFASQSVFPVCLRPFYQAISRPPRVPEHFGEETELFYSSFVQTIERVQGSNRQFRIGGLDQNGEFNLGGRDRPDVDPFFRQGLECQRGDAGMTAHADPDRRDFRHVARTVQT